MCIVFSKNTSIHDSENFLSLHDKLTVENDKLIFGTAVTNFTHI